MSSKKNLPIIQTVQAVGEPLMLIPCEECECEKVHPWRNIDGSIDHTDMCYIIGSQKIIEEWRKTQKIKEE